MRVSIAYKNWKGVVGVRLITPLRIYWGKNQWHPEEQWLMDAYDHEKEATRGFAMKDVSRWESMGVE